MPPITKMVDAKTLTRGDVATQTDFDELEKHATAECFPEAKEENTVHTAFSNEHTVEEEQAHEEQAHDANVDERHISTSSKPSNFAKDWHEPSEYGRGDDAPSLCGNEAPKDLWGFEYYDAVQKELKRISTDSKHLENMTNFLDLHRKTLIVNVYWWWVVHENNSCVDNDNEEDGLFYAGLYQELRHDLIE